MDSFSNDLFESDALEFGGDLGDFPESVDDPAVAESSKEEFLRAAQFAGAEESVGDDEPAAGAKEAMSFFEEGCLVRSTRIATAFDGGDGVEGLRWLSGMLVVAKREGDAGILPGRIGSTGGLAPTARKRG